MNCCVKFVIYKKLSCCREAEWLSVLLKLFLSYSRLCQITPLTRGMCKFLLVFHCYCVYILYCFWDIQRQIIVCPCYQSAVVSKCCFVPFSSHLCHSSSSFNLATLGLIPYELLCEIWNLQEAQLLQRGRMMLCVVETFSKLLKIVWNYTID